MKKIDEALNGSFPKLTADEESSDRWLADAPMDNHLHSSLKLFTCGGDWGVCQADDGTAQA